MIGYLPALVFAAIVLWSAWSQDRAQDNDTEYGLDADEWSL